MFSRHSHRQPAAISAAVWWPIVALAILVTMAVGSPAGRAQDRPVKMGWLAIYTNYEATVTVDGEPYAKRKEYGMVVEAFERHKVHVKVGDKEKTYTVAVMPGEQRVLMVDITNFNTRSKPASAARASKSRAGDDKADDKGDSGKLTVYSKPKGEVYVDGSGLGVSTPMINRLLDIGRHEVQVKWEGGDMSEVKTVRIRKGSKLKLFFRDRGAKRK